jgi:hypothetical protein
MNIILVNHIFLNKLMKKSKTKKKDLNKPISKTALNKLISKRNRKAVKVFNQYIRTKWKLKYAFCPLCNKNPVQCCFHIVSADRKATRFDERNVIGACFACNQQENFWSDLSRVWYIQAFGVSQYIEIVEKSKEEFELTVEFLDNIIMAYAHKLAGLSIINR